MQQLAIKLVSALISTLSVPAVVIGSIAIVGIVLFSTLFGSFAQILIYSYPAKDIEVTRLNDTFTKLELEIKSKALNPPAGYDSYTFDVGEVGHNRDDLLAYFSTKYYKKEGFKIDELRAEIDDILSEAYVDESWVEEIEHESTGTDESGNEYTDYWYTYTYHSILRTKDVSEILKSRLNEDEKKDFNYFKETKGMFSLLNSPLNEDYKTIVTKKFGYQYSLNSTEDIEYIDYMELLTSENKNVYAIMPGIVSAKNGYVQITGANGTSIRYYNVTLNQSDIEVDKKDIIGKTNSSRLKIQILDKDGNFLDPYFHIESKIDSDINVITSFSNEIVNISNITPSGYGKDAVELAKTFVGKNGAYMFNNFITPITGHTTEEWCADFCASVITHSIGGSIKGDTIYDKDGKPFINWSASVANWADYARASGILHKVGSDYKPKAGDLILSYGNHIEMIADPNNFTTISGNSGHNNDNLSMVKTKTAGSPYGWINFSPRWTYENTYIISIPYKEEEKEDVKENS